MMTIYCAADGCGKKNEYSTQKPRFCQFCGSPFDAAFKRPTPKTETTSYASTDYQENYYEPRPKFTKIPKSLAKSCVQVQKKITVKDLQEQEISFERGYQSSNSGPVESNFNAQAELQKLLNNTAQQPQR